MTTPTFVSREEWGARKNKGETAISTPVSHIFIHHTATTEYSDSESCKKSMKTIQNYHMDTKGWDDIGYNFVIGGDGKVYYGRGWNQVGAHTLGFNSKSVAFSFMGDYSTSSTPQVMLDTAKQLIKYAVQKNFVKSDYQLHGHRDAGSTECPGDELYSVIKKWEKFQAGPL